jgi:hypothetical protein
MWMLAHTRVTRIDFPSGSELCRCRSRTYCRCTRVDVKLPPTHNGKRKQPKFENKKLQVFAKKLKLEITGIDDFTGEGARVPMLK